MSQFGSYGPGFNEFYSMNSIGIDKSGDIFVSHFQNEKAIYKPLKSTHLTIHFNTQIGTTQSFDDGYFNYPFSMSLTIINDLYVVDRFNYRIQKFTPQQNSHIISTVATEPRMWWLWQEMQLRQLNLMPQPLMVAQP